MPGDGFIDIQKVNGTEYTLTWEYTTQYGYHVSGTYTGMINGAEVDDNARTVEFNEAVAVYWGESDNGSGEYGLMLYGFDTGMDADIYLDPVYTAIPSEPDSPVMPDGTYTYQNNSNETVGTFPFAVMTVEEPTGREEYEVTGGSFTVSHEGGEYIYDFNLQFSDGYAPMIQTYRGSVDWNAPKPPQKAGTIRNYVERPNYATEHSTRHTRPISEKRSARAAR
jgi:hypothetical protein